VVRERNEDAEMAEKTGKREWKPTWKDVILSSVGGVSFIGQIVLCFLFYNWLDLDVLLYTGWTILAGDLLLGMMSRRAFEKEGRAPEGESWLATTAVVDSGIYAVVRHPIYLSFILLILVLILISQHWLSPILGVPWMVFLYYAMRREEQANIERFGDDYQRYMQKVPRINFLVGIIRLVRRSKRG
jgi:protein-S-isoprenylcysteine O-methyltransferase Ste14